MRKNSVELIIIVTLKEEVKHKYDGKQVHKKTSSVQAVFKHQAHLRHASCNALNNIKNCKTGILLESA